MATGKLTAQSFGVAADDWHILQTARPNVLLVGSESAVAGFLELLLPLLKAPLVHSHDGRFTVPPAGTGTLILRDVSRLDRTSQQQLSDWLSEAHRRTQVISTSSSSPYPFVESGDLSAPLYYTLNVVMIAVRDPES